MEKFVFELSGVPGSGKTTLLKQLQNELSGYDILDDYRFYRKCDTFFNKCRTICFWLMPANRNANRVLTQICRECVATNNKKKYFKKQLNYIRCVSLYRKYGVGTNIAISEGVIQAMLELLDYVDEKKEDKAIDYCVELFCLFKNEFPYIRFIVLKMGFIEANLHINIRNDKRNSVDNMDENKRLLFLERRCRNTDMLLDRIAPKQDHFSILYPGEDHSGVYEQFKKIVDEMERYCDS